LLRAPRAAGARSSDIAALVDLIMEDAGQPVESFTMLNKKAIY
jgi:hypothetical protein